MADNGGRQFLTRTGKKQKASESEYKQCVGE